MTETPHTITPEHLAAAFLTVGVSHLEVGAWIARHRAHRDGLPDIVFHSQILVALERTRELMVAHVNGFGEV